MLRKNKNAQERKSKRAHGNGDTISRKGGNANIRECESARKQERCEICDIE